MHEYSVAHLLNLQHIYCTSILFDFTLHGRLEADAYTYASCINTYMDKFSLLTSQMKSQDSWHVGIC